MITLYRSRATCLATLTAALLGTALSMTSAPALAQAPSGTWTRVAGQDGPFNVSGTKTVRYGAGTQWVSRSMTGNNQWCTTPMFGSDPAPGVANVCEVFVPNTDPSYTWSRVSGQGGTFNIAGTKTVRYGADVRWKQRSMTGNNQWCTDPMFGGDPAPGIANTCEVWTGPAGTAPPPVTVTQPTPLPPVPPHNHGVGLLPSPYTGFSVGSAEVRSTYTGNRAVPNSDGTDVGNFRTVCAPSHMLYDDPLVYPGQPGLAHLHVFFGNAAVTANSTAESIRTTGRSTCRGGILNRSSYWIPALINTQTNRAEVPRTANIYYKTGLAHNEISHAIPRGLRMIAGDMNTSSELPWWLQVAMFECFNTPSMGKFQTIPNCPVGDELIAQIVFPQCWDGVNVTSANHKSHMAYAIRETGRCPSSHPVALPEVAIRAHYAITSANQAVNFKLSSDMYEGPGGYSMHGDFVMGWVEEAMDSFVANCLNIRMDCKSHLLGDGREIF
ncbi:MAG: DUF1996 domain-containing protein [Limnobacter sp.]|uniref:DUF1996 domain-containing protein n=1 Tax=Limnobacter sp. TaxID=2003368 RepID=UPI0022C0AB74|nr:DUF1996 domain-containing protein [Limnobacter sp.]MCZ8015487.1 DUF1996 domain-containing protein [Limnobacter sp.]